MGTIDTAIGFPREIFRTALIKNTKGVILVHNHPSGDITSSEADKHFTSKIVEGSKYLDINILDHIIVGRYKFYSFSDNGHI